MGSKAATKAISALLLLLLAACSNGFQQFYEPAKINYGPAKVPFSGEATVLSGSRNAEADVARMYSDGYGLVGVSSFNGPATDPALAKQQASAVGASHVIITSEYERTVSGAVPITTPTTQTSYSSGTVSAAGGYGSYSGSTTTYGTQTTYMPYSVARYEIRALFFGPLERTGLGIFRREANDQEKQRAGTNKVHVVLATRRGSPAYNSDILPGDFLVSIGEISVDDVPATQNYLSSNANREVVITLIRDGRRLEKKLFNPAGVW